MSNEAEQIAQRQAKLTELVAPRRARRIRIASIGPRRSPRSRRHMARRPARRSRPRTCPCAPRAAFWACARSARRTFSCCRTASSGCRSTSAPTPCRSSTSQIYQAPRPGRSDRRRRPAVPHEDERADDLGVAHPLPGQVPAAAAREVARPQRRRSALPPAVSRSHRQSRRAAGLRDARARGRRHPPLSQRARVSSKSKRR